eukprot:4457196-Pyramimonas_sp.AAC.1
MTKNYQVCVPSQAVQIIQIDRTTRVYGSLLISSQRKLHVLPDADMHANWSQKHSGRSTGTSLWTRSNWQSTPQRTREA